MRRLVLLSAMLTAIAALKVLWLVPAEAQEAKAGRATATLGSAAEQPPPAPPVAPEVSESPPAEVQGLGTEGTAPSPDVAPELVPSETEIPAAEEVPVTTEEVPAAAGEVPAPLPRPRPSSPEIAPDGGRDGRGDGGRDGASGTSGTQATAAATIDAGCNRAATTSDVFGGIVLLAQTFTAGKSGRVDHATVQIHRLDTRTNADYIIMEIRLLDSLGAPTEIPIAQAKIPANSFLNDLDPTITGTFRSAPHLPGYLIAGQQYALVLSIVSNVYAGAFLWPLTAGDACDGMAYIKCCVDPRWYFWSPEAGGGRDFTRWFIYVSPPSHGHSISWLTVKRFGDAVQTRGGEWRKYPDDGYVTISGKLSPFHPNPPSMYVLFYIWNDEGGLTYVDRVDVTADSPYCDPWENEWLVSCSTYDPNTGDFSVRYGLGRSAPVRKERGFTARAYAVHEGADHQPPEPLTGNLVVSSKDF